MDARFPVLWRRVWRSLTIYISAGILIPVSLSIGLRVWKLGAEEALRHMTLVGACVGAVAIVGFATIISLAIAFFFRAMSVRVTDDFIEGRNYWCLKRRIPLSEIDSLSHFSSNGIEAIVVSSKRHGKVYISLHTENLSDLVKLLGTYTTP